MANQPKNYVELAQDEWGTRTYTPNQPIVIQAIREGETLRVIAPSSFRWPVVNAWVWKEVDHEPGVIGLDTWMKLTGMAR